MASKKNVQALKGIKKELESYSVVGVLNMHKLPAGQLFEIREKLRAKAKIKMVRKSVMLLALEQDKRGLKELKAFVQGEPALLLSSTDPFELAGGIAKAKSKAFAKPGDIAPADMVVKAGPTSLPPGPAIGDFQKLKIPAGVEGDKIAIKKDTVIVEKGKEVSKEAAAMLSKLGIKPMDIGLDLRAAWEGGYIYKSDVMFTPPEKYMQDLQSAAMRALSLTISIGWPTKTNIRQLVAKAHREAFALATKAGILTKETVAPMLAKAEAQANALKARLLTQSGSSSQAGEALVKEPASAPGADNAPKGE